MPTACPAAMTVSQSSTPWIERVLDGPSPSGHSCADVGAGDAVDGNGSAGEVAQRDAPAPGERVVARDGGEARLGPYGDGTEPPVLDRHAQHSDVGRPVAEAGQAGVRLHEHQRRARVLRRPAALQGCGVPSERRPGVADPDLAGHVADRALDGGHLGEHTACMRDDPRAQHREGHLASGALQQPRAEGVLQRAHRPRHRGLGDAERRSRVGEGAFVDDGDEGAQLAQLQTHAPSV